MPATEWGWLITPGELEDWIVDDTPDILVLNKPGRVMTHPSRFGPWSSLIGAAREYTGCERLHMPSRLDRETSGVILFAKNRETGCRLQHAVERGRMHKTYLAVLCGGIDESVLVDRPVGPDIGATFFSRQGVIDDGKSACTEFIPLAQGGGYTLVRVHPRSGRRHQIRVHAAWLGHPVAADKLYGPDPSLMIDFMMNGLAGRAGRELPLARHALHAFEVVFRTKHGVETYSAPLAADLDEFCARAMGVNWRDYVGR
jgi:23S rRNA pseudouridine1911/1915/1917 synthase